jgi:hypothetical protein
LRARHHLSAHKETHCTRKPLPESTAMGSKSNDWKTSLNVSMPPDH